MSYLIDRVVICAASAESLDQHQLLHGSGSIRLPARRPSTPDIRASKDTRVDGSRPGVAVRVVGPLPLGGARRAIPKGETRLASAGTQRIAAKTGFASNVRVAISAGRWPEVGEWLVWRKG